VKARHAGVALAVAGAFFAVPAVAADHTISAGPLPNTYATTDVTIDQGDTVTFQNADPTGVFHDVTADQEDGDGKALFASATIEGGKKAPVEGVEFLTTGDYKFHCSVHSFMTGTLHVTTAGTPKPRTPDNPAPSALDTAPPDATVKILDSRIAKVLEHRGLRVRLQTNEPARFKLTASSGKTRVALGTVTSKGGKTAKLGLTKKGKQLLFTANSVRLKLTARVNDAADNRSTASATRTLR
jgi:plastocyanin